MALIRKAGCQSDFCKGRIRCCQLAIGIFNAKLANELSYRAAVKSAKNASEVSRVDTG
jgi:hypothetical protein